MPNLFEYAFVSTWNRLGHIWKPKLRGGLAVGHLVVDGRVTRKIFWIPHLERAEHIVIIGKTGSGKSYLLRHMFLQDLNASRGLIWFEHHDGIPFLLSAIAEEEARTGVDLSSRVILIRPGDLFAVGLNVLEAEGEHETFVQAAALAAILKERWAMQHFGPRTEELLRNSLYVLIACHLTLVELALFLSNDAFRAACLKTVKNPDILEYFELRFEPLSDAMKAVMRDPILNKTFEFTTAPHFKFVLGQAKSTFSFLDVLNEQHIVLIDLNKGRLGKHAATFGSLVLALIQSAAFRRSSRAAFTIYADEVQNLLTSDTDFDVFFSEFRKLGISVVCATQFFGHFSKQMQAAVQAIGTHIFFQLSSSDAQEAGQMLDGGKLLAERLKNLPKRHLIIKTGHYASRQVQVPNIASPRADFTDLVKRSQALYSRPCDEVAAEIEARKPARAAQKEALNGWE